MDAYIGIRNLPFPIVATALGLDISKFKTRKGGAEHYGGCPIHESKTNSTCFSYNANGTFHCFSCSAKGKGSLDLVMSVKKIGFKKAVAFLQGLPQKEVKDAPQVISDVPEGILKPLAKDTWKNYQVECPWLEARIPDAAIRERYGVFQYFNPARKSVYSHRVMIPVRDSEGQLYGYLGRSISEPYGESNPKYLFPKNLAKSHFLFGSYELCKQHQAPLRLLFLVESPLCVLKFASLGFPAVSPFGWSVSPEQITILKGISRGVIYLPDKDRNGEVANIVRNLAQALWVRFPDYPASDPEHLSLEQIQALC